MVYHYTILCAIINDYFTIMPLIAIIAIIALFSLLWRVEVRFFWAKQTSGTFRDEQHTEGIMLAKNPSGLITSAGHWHGLVVPGICTLSSNRRAVSAMNPNAIGNRLGPSGLPLPAPRRMLWIAFNWLQCSASGQIDANCSETGTKHNTKRRIRTTLCIATDGSVAWMCTHHGLFRNLNEKQPKCQKTVCEIK